MWKFEQFFLRSWKIPFYKNETIPYHLNRHFVKHINSKNSLFLTPTDVYEIQLLIKKLKMKSNSSPNDIPSKFLKVASCIVSEWLSKFFNKCMTTGEFPDSWKISHITPIPKVHSPSSSSEYRPISVLPVLSKFLYHRVYSYLTERYLIDKRQYGFRENHSAELAITTIYEELLKNFDNKLITCSLFLDLSKAFDCCDHEILLDKLYHYGIRGVSHKLFLIFLHNRMQCIKIGHLNLHIKGYLAGSLWVVLFRLCFSLFTLTISQKLHLFILLYLVMIFISICQIPVLMFFRQLLTLNYVKLTTGWEPTSFLLTTVRLILCY